MSNNDNKLENEELVEKPGEDQDEPAMGSAAQDSLKTSHLDLPEDFGPMAVRDPRPNTTQLSLGWRILFRLGDKTKTLQLVERIMVGRVADAVGATESSLDLTPYGAYHYGVSRQHAQLTLRDGYLYLEDLGSTNGTRINGFQLTTKQRYRLRDGDEIEFARLRTTVSFKGPDTL